MDERKIVAAAIQMFSTSDKEENKGTAEALMRDVAFAGAEFVALSDLGRFLGL